MQSYFAKLGRMPNAVTPATSFARPGLITVALLVLTVAAYYSVGSFDFTTFDDPQYVVENEHLAQGLTWSGVKWAFTTGHASNWHPLSWLSHMVDVQIFGLQPGPHHLVNLFFHVLNTLLLFGLLYRTTGAAGRSALVAALFAVHPLHVESVAWISERKDLVSTLFFLSTLWAYVSYARRPALHRYLAVFVLMALGLMAKPMLVTLPFVLLLLDFWPLQRLSPESPGRGVITKLVVEKLPLFALIIISSIITFLVQREGGAVSNLDQIPLDLRLSNALVSYIVYISNMVWPVGLAALYPMAESIPLWQPGTAFLLLVAVSFIIVKSARRHPYLPVGWFWYLGTLVPVIGIVQVGSQALADRYTYIPLTGLFIIIAWGGYDLLGRGASKRLPATVLSVLMVAGLAVATWFQVQHWANARTLWTRALAVTSGNYRAHTAYGSLLADDGLHQAAATQFAAAIRIQPSYAEAHNKLGVAFMELGRHAEAVSHYQESLRLQPDLAPAHNNLGNALAAQGKTEEAIIRYQQSLKLNSENPLTHNSLGSALDDLGRVDEAIAQYHMALELNPELAAAHNNLAAAFARKGEIVKAMNEVRNALRLEPGNADYHYNYAVLLIRQGETGKARENLKTALTLNPQFEGARRALASLPRGNMRVEEHKK